MPQYDFAKSFGCEKVFVPQLSRKICVVTAIMNDTSLIPEQPPVGGTRSLAQRFWAFPVTRVVMYVLVFALITTVLIFCLVGILKLLHHQRGHDSEALGTIQEGIFAASAVLASWVMVRFIDKRPWATVGFNPDGLGRGLTRGFVIGAAFLTLGISVSGLIGVYHVTAFRPSALVLFPLITFLTVAVFEETFFRGYLFQTLEARWGSGAALISTAVFFGLAHLANPIQDVTLLERLSGPVFICLEAGLPLAAAYLLTRRLWLPIGIHWAWDYCEGPIYGCADSGMHDPHTLLQSHFVGPYLLTGGPFGPESGLVFLVIGTGMGLLLLRAAVKNGQWRPRRQAWIDPA